MQTIKKYANRKLYHTNRKRYITLDEIAALIRDGEEVVVVDNETGEEITASILAQVVAQTRRGLLPTHMLTDLIQAGGERIAEVRRSIWAGFGGAVLVDAEIARRLEQLHAEGALDAEEVARLRGLLLGPESDAVPAALSDMPSRSDLARLSAQVDGLAAAVERLLAERENHERASEKQRSMPDEGSAK